MSLLLLLIVTQDATITTNKGEFSGKIDKVVIDTKSLGKVQVAGKDIYKVHLTKFRPINTDDVKKKIAELVTKLQNDDPETRESASKELNTMGPTIIQHLDEYKNHSDPEVKSRVELLISAFKENKERLFDTVMSNDFILNGCITSFIFNGKETKTDEIQSVKITNKAEKTDGPLFILSDGCKISAKIANQILKFNCDSKLLEIKKDDLNSINSFNKKITVNKKEVQGELAESIEIESRTGKFTLKPDMIVSYTQKTTFIHHIIEGTWKWKWGKSHEIVLTLTWTGENVEGEATVLYRSGTFKCKFSGTINNNVFEGKIESTDGQATTCTMTLKDGKISENKISCDYRLEFKSAFEASTSNSKCDFVKQEK